MGRRARFASAQDAGSAQKLARALRLKSAAAGTADYIDPFKPVQVERLAREFGSPLLVIDCERVRQQYRALQEALPRVDLHYALKPLPHPSVVATLRDAGAWFDLATTGEIDVVREQGIGPERCIHTHPIKRDSDIRDALNFGIDTFVVDNPDEISKFVRYRDRARVLVRVAFRSPNAVVDLSRKFGCDPADALQLLELAQRLEVRVRGFSFHVGSQAVDSAKHVEATYACVELIATARARNLATIDMLDIGGGFPVNYGKLVQPIGEFCAPCAQRWRPYRPIFASSPSRGGSSAHQPRSASPRSWAGPAATACGGITWMTGCTAPSAASSTITPTIRSARCAPVPICSPRCWPVPPATASTSLPRTCCCRS